MSCQPSPSRAGWSFESSRSPDSAVRSIPPTNAVSSSTTTSFSWWQWNGRSRASSAIEMRVPPASSWHACRTSPRSGWKSGSGAPAQARTRTSTRSAASARSSRSVGPSSSSRNEASKCQPARWTCERAERIASAMRGSASAPSRNGSTRQPARGANDAVPRPAAVGRRIDRLRRCRGAAAAGRGGRGRPARSSPRRDRRGGSGDMEPRRVHARAAKNLTRSARRTCCRCRRR